LAASSSAPLEPSRLSILPKPRRKRSKWRWIAGGLLISLGIAAISVRFVISRAQPILRARVIETLSARFKSRVELAEFHVWIADGVHVEGKGLEIYGASDPNPWEAGVQPLLKIDEFRFQSALRSLFREPMHVDTIYVRGLTLNVPPAHDRQQMKNLVQTQEDQSQEDQPQKDQPQKDQPQKDQPHEVQPQENQRRGKQPREKMSIAVDSIVCEDTKLLINTSKPGKPPLEFDIGDLKMKEIGPGQPLRFDATLVNPKPVGDIHSTGQFGPFNEASPRDSAMSGSYSFTHADLGTLKGIGGILSSTGTYGGTLGRIEVTGKTDTPDFRINVSGHRVPLRTDFHAIVDGTDGDTYLDPVKATVLHSSFTAKGKIVRVENPHGHDIELDVVLGVATVEDLLALGVKTEPPIMTGSVAMHTKLSLLPGDADVANRLALDGTFHIPEGHFTNDKIQGPINSLSRRSQGKIKGSTEPADMVTSDLKGAFTLREGVLSFSSLHFLIPGTHADATGQYSLDGNTFDFHGTLRLDAKLSQMTTGWKSILLKPVDPFFEKNGAGTEIPFKITGTRDEPHFGLDFHQKDDSAHESHDAAPATH